MEPDLHPSVKILVRELLLLLARVQLLLLLLSLEHLLLLDWVPVLLLLLRSGGDGGCENVTVLLPALIEAPTC